MQGQRDYPGYQWKDSLEWYWRKGRWSTRDEGPQGEKEIFWVQVALDFQAATQLGIARTLGAEAEKETLEQKGKAMTAMSRNMATMFGEEVVPGGGKSMSIKVGTLQLVGFMGNCLGFKGRLSLCVLQLYMRFCCSKCWRQTPKEIHQL